MSFYSTVGWRLGLQQITGLLVTTFLLGTFYRSASLYHPQRRAILHLKTQKRKIKNKDKEKNKLQDDRPPFFEFTTLKSRTVRIILFSALVSHVGIYSPLFFLVSYLPFYSHITTYSRFGTFSNALYLIPLNQCFLPLTILRRFIFWRIRKKCKISMNYEFKRMVIEHNYRKKIPKGASRNHVAS